MAQLIYAMLPRPRRPIAFIKPEDSVLHCAKRMRDENIGALVVHDGHALIGIVSERDIVRACVSKGLDASILTVADVVFPEVSLLDAEDTIEHAMKIVTRTKRRHLLIREKGELTAILSIGDLLFYLLEDKSKVIEHLENYIHT